MAHVKQDKVVELAAFAEPVAAPAAATSLSARNTEFLKDVDVTLEIRLGEASITVHDFFDLKDGSVVELNRQVDDPVDVLLNGKVVARGQLVASGDQFGVKVTEIRDATAQ